LRAGEEAGRVEAVFHARRFPLARLRRAPRPRKPAEAESRSLWRINKVYWTCIGVVLAWAVLRTLGVGGALPVAHLAGFYGIIGVAALNLGGRSLAVLARSRGRIFNDHLGWIFTIMDLACVAAGRASDRRGGQHAVDRAVRGRGRRNDLVAPERGLAGTLGRRGRPRWPER
jgi:hypothetical protein